MEQINKEMNALKDELEQVKKERDFLLFELNILREVFDRVRNERDGMKASIEAGVQWKALGHTDGTNQLH